MSDGLLGSSIYDDDADRFFRAEAHRQGWMKGNPHPPGHGLGLWAYYRSIGVLPPEKLERVIPAREFNNWEWGEE